MTMKPLIPLLPVLALALAGCETAPVTGRQQLILISSGQAASLGASAFEDIRAKTPAITGTAEAAMVERVGRRIARQIGENGSAAWEFVLFKDDTPNAFALPGGKVGVNSGLFQVAKSEAQLAAVLGHEIAHVTARHSAERMSRDMLTQLGIGAVSTVSDNQQMVGAVAQAATLGLVLPFSRDQESEADRIGIIYMAGAGYDPREAVALWRNFATLGGERPPQFLSTHPDPERRIERLEALMPEAMAIYERSGGS